VLGHVDEAFGAGCGARGRFHDGLGLAYEGIHGAVGIRAWIHVQQGNPAYRPYRSGYGVDDRPIAPLAEIGYAFH
jgi:hypothetical protein